MIRKLSWIKKCCSIVLIHNSLFIAAYILEFRQSCYAEQSLPFQAEIASDSINIRADSRANSEIICTLNKNSKVEVVSCNYDWYKIILPKESPAYIKKSLTECLSYNIFDSSVTVEKNTQQLCQNIKVAKDSVNIRLRPTESSPIIGRAIKNQIFSVIKEDNGWYKIEPSGNIYGWVHKNFISTLQKAQSFTKENLSPLEDISIEGIIMPYGRIFNRQATHKLISPDAKTYLLKGDKKSLDSLIRQKVRLTARKISTSNQKYQLLQIITIEQLN